MTLSEAKRIDKLIYDLAFYEVTKGEMQVGMDMESAMKTHSEVSKKFNLFKRLIKSGEFTLSELEVEVVRKYAATTEKGPLTVNNLDEFVKEYDNNSKKKKDTLSNDIDKFADTFVKLLTDPKSFNLPSNTLGKNPHYDLDKLQDTRLDEYYDDFGGEYYDDFGGEYYDDFGDEDLDEESEES
jgi:hypothetical protein